MLWILEKKFVINYCTVWLDKKVSVHIKMVYISTEDLSSTEDNTVELNPIKYILIMYSFSRSTSCAIFNR